MAGLTPMKAKTILKEGMARGKKLTDKQKGLFGLIASNKRPKNTIAQLKALKK